MRVTFNPNEEKIKEICALSSENAAKWIKNTDTGEMIFFPSDSAFHAEVAKAFHVKNYTKGIATT